MSSFRSLLFLALLAAFVCAHVGMAKPHKRSLQSVEAIGVGRSVRVSAGGSTLRGRSRPVDGTTLIYFNDGEILNVIEGPQRGSDGYNWWRCSSPRGSGWSREDFLREHSTSPPPANPPPANPPPSSSGIRVGGAVRVNSGPLRGRSTPVTGSVAVWFQQGERLNVERGPQRGSDNYNWWFCRNGRGAGWSREDFLTADGNAGPVPPVPQPPVPQPQPPVPAGNYPMYKQCGQPYSGQQLGTCAGIDICKAGCAISSVAMLLTKRGKTINPGELNDFLKNNGGYADGCLIYWGRPDSFGVTRFAGSIGASESAICGGLAAGKGMIAWVLNRSHFVLITGCSGNGWVTVHDPYFNTGSYAINTINSVMVYN